MVVTHQPPHLATLHPPFFSHEFGNIGTAEPGLPSPDGAAGYGHNAPPANQENGE
jgi:hypothetical protein